MIILTAAALLAVGAYLFATNIVYILMWLTEPLVKYIP